MAGWAYGALLGFDTETTGVDPARDRIVAAALVHRTTASTATSTWLIDPGIEIPEPASAVHGITTQDVRESGRPAREALEELAGALARALGEGTPVVAFNAAFDLGVLDAELDRHGLRRLAERVSGSAGGVPSGREGFSRQEEVGPVLDPLVLDRALERSRPGPRRLVDLCAVYGVSVDGALHTAAVDAAATLDVLAAMGRRHPALARMPAEQAHAWQTTLRRARQERSAHLPRSTALGPAYAARRERLRAERAAAQGRE